jgi:hypothetical protein
MGLLAASRRLSGGDSQRPDRIQAPAESARPVTISTAPGINAQFIPL